MREQINPSLFSAAFRRRARAAMSGQPPIWKWVLWAAAALALAEAVGIAVWYWPGSLPDSDTSGVWTALADDLARGTFYRPLEGPLGYGGTRYGPLFFSLHAGLMRMGLTPVGAGAAATLGSAAAFGASLYAFIRRFGVRRAVALPASLLAFGTVSVQMTALGVRGDFLAAALNLAGMSAAVAWIRDRRRAALAAAAVAFAAADLTKLTSLFGLAAVGLWAWIRGDRRAATALAGASAGLAIAGFCLANAASDGRMLADFRATATAGAPLDFSLGYGALGRMAAATSADPLFCLLIIPAALALVGLARERPPGLPCVYLAAAVAATALIFSTPGTYFNHLIDVSGAAAAVVAVALERRRGRTLVSMGVALYGLGLAVTCLPGAPSVHRFFARVHRPEAAGVRSFFAHAGGAAHPVLAINPLIPILTGERPVVADAFMFRVLAGRDPALSRRLLGRIAKGEFGSVVLNNWPVAFERDVDSPDDPLIAERWPAVEQGESLGPGFFPALRSRYRIVLVRRPYIYLLRSEDASAFRN